jgi:hypothetical protein
MMQKGHSKFAPSVFFDGASMAQKFCAAIKSALRKNRWRKSCAIALWRWRTNGALRLRAVMIFPT